MFKKFWKNKKVIVTGHTGFKGAWLSYWLDFLGAKVVGISKDIPSKPSLFKILNLKKKIIHINLDLRDLKRVKKVLKKHQPNFIFHLAAQSLVKKSYNKPIETFTTNIIGTLNLLESVKMIKKKCVSVIVTSDKSYKNLELERGYHESDILGGDDPYSASKASAELVINSYIKSFFNSKSKTNNKFFAVARAGNVIGGGDWSKDRLIPDCMKSWSKKKIVKIRFPKSTRPWQHVLEALRGYLVLSMKLSKRKKAIHGEPFNFGPKINQNKTVIELVKEMKIYWNKVNWSISTSQKNRFESKLLELNSNKAKKILNWKPKLSFSKTIEMVVKWYKYYYQKKDNMNNFTKKQLLEYIQLVK